MPREVLRSGHDAVLLRSPYVCASHSRNQKRIAAERTYIDYRVASVVVDVYDRVEVNLNTKGSCFFSRYSPRLISEVGIARSTERHCSGQPGRANVTKANSSFKV